MDVSARAVGDFVEAASHASSVSAFRARAIEVLGELFAFDRCGIFGDPSTSDEPSIVGPGLDSYRAYQRDRRRYLPDLRRVHRMARAEGGLVELVSVLRELATFAEVVTRARVKVALYAPLRVPGALPSTLVLGRSLAHPFEHQELTLMRKVLPAVALGEVLHRQLIADREPWRMCPIDLPPLGRREAEVLEYAVAGLTTDQIALACGTSPNTIKRQLSSLFRKLGAGSRAELVALALRAGLVRTVEQQLA